MNGRTGDDHQLSLPIEPRTADVFAHAWPAMPEPVRDVLVFLRCPQCQQRKTVLVPRASRRQLRLERMLPALPLRHWVFSLGESAQPRLAAEPRVRTRVARACVAATFDCLRRVAARHGVPGPLRCGAVSAIHRVGATLEANVHVHALVLDGVHAWTPNGALAFHPLPAPRARDLQRTLAELRGTLDGLLARITPRPTIMRTSTPRAHRVARSASNRPLVRPVLDPATDVLIQRHGELDVRAGPTVAADDRALRDRLCRYVARAPFDPSAVEPGPRGRLHYRMHHPFADGSTHVELSPEVLAERLAALAEGELRPPIAFHGVLAAAAAAKAAGTGPSRQLALLELPPRGGRSRSRPPSLRCPRCRSPMEVVGVEPALALRVA
ncbi:transposase [Paraliomyxa miuraensis]|uniref:transposase n=1 Tax=Paraliomyxa miuraensis TaxID=376150 RepID=UPI002259F28C|nr:transposase [Paraliomyxa miuraensis]MCX4244338.1 transposase [Paraliomyxa miuraensis]